MPAVELPALAGLQVERVALERCDDGHSAGLAEGRSVPTTVRQQSRKDG